MASFNIFMRASVHPTQLYSKFRQHNNFSFHNNFYCLNQSNKNGVTKTIPVVCRKYLSTESNNEQQNLSMVARMKQMYKDYWYVLVPVHLVTSVCWLGGFYYLAKRYYKLFIFLS